MAITVSATTVANLETRALTYCFLRIYCLSDFTSTDGPQYESGRLGSSQFFLNSRCTITNGVISVPAITHPQPVPSQIDTRFIAGFFDYRGRLIAVFENNYLLPTLLGSPITWQQIREFTDSGTTNIGPPNGVSIMGSVGNIVFSNSPTVTFGANQSTITASAAGGGTANLSFSAGTSSGVLPQLVFGDSNGVSFGLSGSTLTATVQTNFSANIAISAGTRGATRSDFTFADSKGVSFGINGAGVVTATVKTDYQSSGNYLTTAMASDRGTDFVQASAAFAGTSASGTIGSNGISVSIGPYLTTAMQSNAATISNIVVSAGTRVQTRSDFTFADSKGISFGIDGLGVITATVKTDYQSSGAYLTTAMQSNAATISNIKVSGGTLSQNRSDITFADSNGLSWGLNTNGVLTGTVKTDYQSSGAYLTTAMQSNAATISNIKVSAGTLSANRSDITFADSNGVSWGLNTNGVITASAAGGTGGGGNVNFSAGTTSNTLSNVVFSNSNLMSFGLSGSTITGSVPGTSSLLGTGIVAVLASSNSISIGAAYPDLQYFELDDAQGMGLMTNITAINSKPIFIPFILKGNLTNNNMFLQVSRSTSGSNLFTVQAGIYTYVNSTSIDLLDSLQNTFSASNTGSVSGVRYIQLSGWGASATALTPGAYVMGLNFSAANTASMNYSLFGGATASNPVGYISSGSDQNNTTATNAGVVNFWGRYTANSGTIPSGVAQADILANFTGGSTPLAPWFVLKP